MPAKPPMEIRQTGQTNSGPRVVMVAGEASGDMYGRLIMEEIRQQEPGASFSGIGGPAMAEAGQERLYKADDLAVMGLFDVLPKLGLFYKSLKAMKRLLAESMPDLLILIDFQDYNLRLARAARKLGVKTLFFIGPKAWAWRRGRAFKLARVIDRLAVILPFEVDFWREIDPNLPVNYVGHPLVDHVAAHPATGDLAAGPGEEVVGLLPGSRMSEIKWLLPMLLKTAEILAAERPGLRFLLPLAPGLPKELVLAKIGPVPPWLTILNGRSLEVMRASRLLLAASGTATLEAALVGAPMVVVYKFGAISRQIGKLVLSIRLFSLPNLIAGREIVPELIADTPDAVKLADKAREFLGDPGLWQTTREELALVAEKVGGPGACRRTAELALRMLTERG